MVVCLKHNIMCPQVVKIDPSIHNFSMKLILAFGECDRVCDEKGTNSMINMDI